jgi:hypothetical protein
MAVMILIPLAGINAAWQFDSRPLTKADWDPWKSNPNVPDAFIFAAQTVGRLPTPPQLWYAAVSLLDSNATEKAVYMLGRVHDGGHPLYFLIALAYKIPAPIQLLIVTGFAITLYRLACGSLAASHVFWLAPPVLYFALASMSSLQLGIRLVLPAMAFLLIFAGVALEWSRSRRWSAAICAALLCWVSVRMIGLYPRYISYFNSWAGGPENAINLLSDSNLDWGQDLRTLAQVIDREHIPKIHLSYFGTDNPFAHIPENRIQLLAPPWNPDLVRSRRLAPEPGFYAVSATLLTGQFFPREYRDYYAEFRQRKPFTRAGNSIYLYRIP